MLNSLMEATVELFADHPTNKRRIAEGHLPATNVWLWGIGKAPKLEPFTAAYGPQGATITAVGGVGAAGAAPESGLFEHLFVMCWLAEPLQPPVLLWA